MKKSNTLIALLLVCTTLFGLCACSCNDEPEYDPLYQFDYVGETDLSQYGTLSSSVYQNITLTLGPECHYTEKTLQNWLKTDIFAVYLDSRKITDRAVTKDDTICYYYTATVNGEVVDSHVSTAEKEVAPKKIKLSSVNAFNIDGWNDCMVGATPGIPKLFTLKAPDNYGNTAMRGQEVSFAVTVSYIEEKFERDALTASYLKEIVHYETEETEDDKVVAAFLKDAEEYLREVAEDNKQQALEDEVLRLITSHFVVKGYPGQDVTYQYSNQYNLFESRWQQDNYNYYQYYGEENHFPTLESYLKSWFDTDTEEEAVVCLDALAASLVLDNLAVAAVFHNQQMTVTQEEFEARKQLIIEEYVENGYITEADANKTIDSAFVYNELMWEKVMDYLLSESNCTVIIQDS